MAKHLEAYRRRLMSVADKLAGQCGSLPVDTRQLCEWFGISVTSEERLSKQRFKAALSFENGSLERPKVTVGSSLFGTAYARLCIAHEIGHLILIREYGAVPRGRVEYWKYEALCDEFARRILVPEPYIKSLLKEKPSADGNILMRSLDVEQEAFITWIHGARRLADSLSHVCFFRLEHQANGAFFVAATSVNNAKGRSSVISANTTLARYLGQMIEKATSTGRSKVTEVATDLFSQKGHRLRLDSGHRQVFAVCRRRTRGNSEVLLVAT